MPNGVKFCGCGHGQEMIPALKKLLGLTRRKYVGLLT